MHWNKQSLATLKAYHATKGLVMLDPIPELPDNTPISEVDLPARIRNVLAGAGLKTVGEVRSNGKAETLPPGEPTSVAAAAAARA